MKKVYILVALLFEQGALRFHLALGPTKDGIGLTFYTDSLEFQGGDSLTRLPPPPRLLGLVGLVRACHPLGSFSPLGGVKVVKVPAPPPPIGPGTPWAIPRRGFQVSHFRFQPLDLSPHSPKLRGSRLEVPSFPCPPPHHSHR